MLSKTYWALIGPVWSRRIWGDGRAIGSGTTICYCRASQGGVRMGQKSHSWLYTIVYERFGMRYIGQCEKYECYDRLALGIGPCDCIGLWLSEACC